MNRKNSKGTCASPCGENEVSEREVCKVLTALQTHMSRKSLSVTYIGRRIRHGHSHGQPSSRIIAIGKGIVLWSWANRMFSVGVCPAELECQLLGLVQACLRLSRLTHSTQTVALAKQSCEERGEEREKERRQK